MDGKEEEEKLISSSTPRLRFNQVDDGSTTQDVIAKAVSKFWGIKVSLRKRGVAA